jgi:hypothetical protein
VDLAILVDGDDPYHRPSLPVAGQKEGAGLHTIGEHRDTVKSVDGEHPTGISTKNLCIEQAARTTCKSSSKAPSDRTNRIFIAKHATQRL